MKIAQSLAHRKRAPAALWRHRANRLLPHGGACRTWPRRHSVRERRLDHCGQSRPLRTQGPPSRRQRAQYDTLYMLMLDRVRQRADEFDILHFHIDQFHFPSFGTSQVAPSLRCTGARIARSALALCGLNDMPLVSISNAQRDRFRVPICGYRSPRHSPELHRAGAEAAGSYLAFLGRISPEKRPTARFGIARASGIPLKIAAKVDRVDEVYFRTQIEPFLLSGASNLSVRSTISRRSQFLGNAQALLFPIDWPEPSGSP